MSTLTSSVPFDAGEKSRQLIENGFCILNDILDSDVINRTREISMNSVLGLSGEQLADAKAAGSLINSDDEPGLAECVGNPRAVSALEAMGFGDVKFWKAVIISKPPHGPRLYWHQDCMMWDDPRAYSDYSPMIFLMYYLDDTSRENGCLRLLPGSHREWRELHGMGMAHGPEVSRAEDMSDPRFGSFSGEIDVPMKAGDLVVGDARLFHSTHGNESDKHRTVITIWFHPLFGGLQEQTQSWIHHQFHDRHGEWPAPALESLGTLIPDYRGSAEPMKVNRQPDRTRLHL